MSLANSLGRDSVAKAEPAPLLGSQVVDHLRRLIITQQLAAETHLVEAQLSESFAVSRGPVRDALRQLEAEGLVQSRKRGVFVVGLTHADIDELYVLRALLEEQATRMCATRTTALNFASAHTALRAMRAAADEQDPIAFAMADLDFHTCFYTLCGNRRLAAVWQQYRPTFAGILSVTNAEDSDLHPTLDDHRDLLRAVESGDEEQAVLLLRTHLDGSRARMTAAYARYVTTRNSIPDA